MREEVLKSKFGSTGLVLGPHLIMWSKFILGQILDALSVLDDAALGKKTSWNFLTALAIYPIWKVHPRMLVADNPHTETRSFRV